MDSDTSRELFARLKAVTDGMDLPPLRRIDPLWLLRNMRIRNSTHPYLDHATELCKELVRAKVYKKPPIEK